MSDIGNGRAGRGDLGIVGRGSAGGLPASRLGEDPTRSGLLLAECPRGQHVSREQRRGPVEEEGDDHN
jgi:hypothetical protein